MSSGCYIVPTEIAQHCLSPAGIASLVKAMMNGARVRPLAMIRKLRGAWVVRFEFEEAIGPQNDRSDAMQLTLTVHPEGRL